MDKRQRQSDRPTLPPIRDLFRGLLASRAISSSLTKLADELSRTTTVQESPSLTIARLRMEDEAQPLPRSRQSSLPSSLGPPVHSLPIHQSQHIAPNFYPLTRSYSDCQSRHESTSIPTRSISYGHHSTPSLQVQLQREGLVRDLQAYDNRERHFAEDQAPIAPYSSFPGLSSDRPQQPHLWVLPTERGSGRSHQEDDERTPVGPYRSLTSMAPNRSGEPGIEASASTSASKYECSFCGKGFNRPSSLKIHRNSHTGEKHLMLFSNQIILAFACPVEGCGRSFSVLSNMRRHARVHNQPLRQPSTVTYQYQQPELSGDECTEKHSPQPYISENDLTKEDWAASNPNSVEVASSYTVPHSQSHWVSSDPNVWQQRRNSGASISSTSSRRSRSVSSDGNGEQDDGRPEKRSRHTPQHIASGRP
ncbi:hypothetical protein AX16_005218 [Volvariella volvacea WC 439]|nr:hypothetical protein AX16_005218 [Volvariella volvacea WC 439]